MTQTAGSRAGIAAQGLLGIVGSIVRLVTGAFATVLVVQILLTVLGANPLNAVRQFFAVVADSLTLGLANLFPVASPTLQVVVSYGLPAIAWLIIGSIVVSLLRRLARPRSGLR